MIEARAVVLRVADGQARLRVLDREDGCGRCDEPGGCRSVRLAYAVRPPKSEFDLPDTLGVTVGEEVLLRMQDGSALRGALAGYGLGVVLLLAGAGTGQALAPAGQTDVFALAGALAGLVLAWVGNRLLHRSRRWRGSLAMHMTRPAAACTFDLTETR